MRLRASRPEAASETADTILANTLRTPTRTLCGWGGLAPAASMMVCVCAEPNERNLTTTHLIGAEGDESLIIPVWDVTVTVSTRRGGGAEFTEPARGTAESETVTVDGSL